MSLALILLLITAVSILWYRSYWPAGTEVAAVQCTPDAPAWSADQRLKVMSYNVQYMASKNYVFFYDVDVEDEERLAAVERADKVLASQPSEEHVYWTVDQVAAVIEREDPDIVLLQEVNGPDDSRTHYIDQTAELLARLPEKAYPCRSDSSYWKAEFILHPEVMGPVNMQLLTLSKYRMERSIRHQLPRIPRSTLFAPFHFQRALLESHIATVDGAGLAVINTHFDAWGAGTGIMRRQIRRTQSLLQDLDEDGIPWVLGGDLNLLPPDDNRQRQRILAAGTGYYDETPPITPLYERYRGIPSLQSLMSDEPGPWFTFFPNDPTVTGPDRTIDYLFYSDQWQLLDAYVLQEATLDISDHMPVIGTYRFTAP